MFVAVLILGACEGTLLEEIRLASRASLPEIAILVDGKLIGPDSVLDIGIHSTSAAARSITVTVKNTGEASLDSPAGAIELTFAGGSH